MTRLAAAVMGLALIAGRVDALRTRELVKVKLGNKDDVKPKDAANALALATNAAVVQVIGKTATLFRENPQLVIDITDTMDLKLKALACHQSQVPDFAAVQDVGVVVCSHAAALGRAVFDGLEVRTSAG